MRLIRNFDDIDAVFGGSHNHPTGDPRALAVNTTRGALAQTPKIYRLGTLTVGPPIPATAGTGAVLVATVQAKIAELKPRMHVCAR